MVGGKVDDEWRKRLGRLRNNDEEEVADILFRLPIIRDESPAPLLSRRALIGRARVASGGGERFPGKTQAIVKSAGWRYSAQGTLALRDYVANRDGINGCIQLYDELGVPVDGDEAKQKIRDWPKGGKENAIHAWHLIFSLPSKDFERDRYPFRQVCRKTVDALFAEHGYEALWGVHEDKPGRLHAHVILCAHSKLGRKWHFDKLGDMFDTMRAELAHLATLAGFQANASRREDRAKVRERIVNGDEPLRTAKSFPAWRDGDGRPEVRVPNWFKKYGNPAATKSPKPTWLQRMLNIDSSPQRQGCVDLRVIEMFASIYRDPDLAIESFAFMAQESADRKHRFHLHPSRYALWNLKHRPELFGALVNVEGLKERLEKLVRYAKRLTVSAAQFDPVHLPHDRTAQNKQVMQDRLGVQTSLSRLADNDEAVNQGDSRAVSIRREVQRIAQLLLPSSSISAIGIHPVPMSDTPLSAPKPKRLAKTPSSSGGGEGKVVGKSQELPAQASPSRRPSRRRSFDLDMD